MSGADLIRTSSQQQERAAKLEITAQEVKPTNQASQSNLDQETKGALLRFARFIHKDGKRESPSQKKTSAGKNHPYSKAQEPLQHLYEVGQNIDIYV
jgi:hypothetical protein